MFRNSDLPAEFPNQWGRYFSLPPLAYFLLLFLFVIRNQYKFPIQLLASLFDSLFLLGIFFFFFNLKNPLSVALGACTPAPTPLKVTIYSDLFKFNQGELMNS